MTGVFSHLGLRDGVWPWLGQIESWDREAWPVPAFYHVEELTGRVKERRYDDQLRAVTDSYVPVGDRVDGPEDGSMGAMFVQSRLDRLPIDESPMRKLGWVSRRG
jgi:hypothetical protein